MGVAQVVGIAIVLISLNIIEAHLEVSLGSDNAQWTLSNDKLQIHVNASVPGGVYTDLAKAGVIFPVDELYYRFNDVNTRWVAYENWNYTTTFQWNATSTAGSIILDCKGLDTAASIYLNGNLLGTTDNMFTRYKFEINKSVLANNTLLIAFESPVTHAEKAYELQGHNSTDIIFGLIFSLKKHFTVRIFA